MAGERQPPATKTPMTGLRLLVPETIVLDDLDRHVSADFEATLAALSKAGAHITRAKLPVFGNIAPINRKGGISAAESHAWHHPLLATKRAVYDQRVLARISRGGDISATEYIELLNLRAKAVADYEASLADYDAILSPTVPVVAPRIEDCAAEDAYTKTNILVLRNTMMINIVDGCSIAVPMMKPGAAPTSLMISRPAMGDQRLFDIADGIEAVLAARG